MKLAEALMERQDLTRDIKRLKEKVNSDMVVEESSYASDLTDEQDYNLNIYYQMMNELYNLNVKINKANEGIREKLEKLKILDSEIDFINTLRVMTLNKNERSSFSIYKDSAIRYISVISSDLIEEELKNLEKERRQIDKEVQSYNWTTEID